MSIFRQKGLADATDSELAQALGISPATLQVQHPSRESLITKCLRDDLERQKQDHNSFYTYYATPVERLYALIDYSIQDLATVVPQYLTDFARYPAAWQVLQDHLAEYSAPQLQQLLNEGIRQGLFRSDINIRLVTIILIQQVNIALTPGIFPAGSFQASEIFRSIFLYYIRGLCTDQGARLAAEHFARV